MGDANEETESYLNNLVSKTLSGEYDEAIRKGNFPEEEFEKEYRYISDPSEAPEDANVEEGPRGGLRYQVGGSGGGDGSGGFDPETDGPSNLDEAVEQLLPTTRDEEMRERVTEAVRDLPRGATEEQVGTELMGQGLSREEAQAVAPGLTEFAGEFRDDRNEVTQATEDALTAVTDIDSTAAGRVVDRLESLDNPDQYDVRSALDEEGIEGEERQMVEEELSDSLRDEGGDGGGDGSGGFV
ncbi:MAG: hypothetical protein ABEK59_01230 [Halobacteria archaeon]